MTFWRWKYARCVLIRELVTWTAFNECTINQWISSNSLSAAWKRSSEEKLTVEHTNILLCLLFLQYIIEDWILSTCHRGNCYTHPSNKQLVSSITTMINVPHVSVWQHWWGGQTCYRFLIHEMCTGRCKTCRNLTGTCKGRCGLELHCDRY